jgi:DNA-directed RNA polymerase subunit RPC12/RpoP
VSNKDKRGAGDLQERLVAMEQAARRGEAYHWDEQDEGRVGEARTRSLTETRFPCGQCGASLHYAIGTDSLACQYCGHLNEIEQGDEPLVELDLHTALVELEQAKARSPESQIMSCPNCAASFALDAHIHAGDCPFCGTSVVTTTADSKPIKPKGLLPFAITADQARDFYKSWLKSLWFAPNALKEFARDDAQLNGVYIPYWTYDSDTATAYRGQRGDVYCVTQRYRTVVNGRSVTRTRRIPKIRWSPASGRTSRHFDDVLVGATRTLPRKITDWLAPWDLEELVPYREDYLSGFSSEVYQVDLDEGFNHAQVIMDKVIRGDVRRSIGGDQQRIHSLRTQHSDTTFKHVLLPVWSAGFTFRDKSYRFVVNGRSGKVRGERPWSRVKIALAVLAALAVAIPLLFFVAASQSGGVGMSTGRSLDFDFNLPRYEVFDWSLEPAPSNWPQRNTW